MAQLLPVCVLLDIKAMELTAEVKTHKHTQPVEILYIISSLVQLLVSQSSICAAGPTVDVQNLLSARRSLRERGPVPVKRGTLEMGSCARVCTPDPVLT